MIRANDIEVRELVWELVQEILLAPMTESTESYIRTRLSATGYGNIPEEQTQEICFLVQSRLERLREE